MKIQEGLKKLNDGNCGAKFHFKFIEGVILRVFEDWLELKVREIFLGSLEIDFYVFLRKQSSFNKILQKNWKKLYFFAKIKI